MNPLDLRILEIAKRRTVYGDWSFAKQLDASREEVRAALKRLRSKKLIYTSDRALKNYFGSIEAGYRAN